MAEQNQTTLSAMRRYIFQSRLSLFDFTAVAGAVLLAQTGRLWPIVIAVLIMVIGVPLSVRMEESVSNGR